MSAVPQTDASSATTHRLYEQYGKQIYAYCFQRLRSREEAEDAVQTTFLNAFRALQRGTVTEFQQAWLFKIAQNVCLERREASGKRAQLESPSDLQVLQETAPAHATHDSEQLIGVEAALHKIPGNQRKAILLREWQGLSYREIGDELGLSQAAVEMLIFRARRSLATALEQPEEQLTKKQRRAGGGRALNVGSLITALKTMFTGGAAVKMVAVAVTAGAAAVTLIAPPRHMIATHFDHHAKAASAPVHPAAVPTSAIGSQHTALTSLAAQHVVEPRLSTLEHRVHSAAVTHARTRRKIVTIGPARRRDAPTHATLPTVPAAAPLPAATVPAPAAAAPAPSTATTTSATTTTSTGSGGQSSPPPQQQPKPKPRPKHAPPPTPPPSGDGGGGGSSQQQPPPTQDPQPQQQPPPTTGDDSGSSEGQNDQGDDNGTGNGNGNAYGHDKGKGHGDHGGGQGQGNGQQGGPPNQPDPQPDPNPQPQPPPESQGQGQGQGQGNGNGQGDGGGKGQNPQPPQTPAPPPGAPTAGGDGGDPGQGQGQGQGQGNGQGNGNGNGQQGQGHGNGNGNGNGGGQGHGKGH